MPTYQYACTNAACGHQFELVQAFTDAAVSECPVCAERIRKVYGSVGVVFKGSGFYRNDSREAAGRSGSEVKAGSESSDSKASDSKSSDPKSSDSKASDKSAGTKTSDTKSESGGTRAGSSSGSNASSDKSTAKSSTGTASTNPSKRSA